MFLCRRCLLSDEASTPCPRCGQERTAVHPGEPADPVRRPLIDPDGKVRTRAPRWWLRETMSEGARWLEAVVTVHLVSDQRSSNRDA